MAADYRIGHRSFTNLSLYAFGLSGVWTGVGAGILPFKVLEALELGPIEVFGYALNKNGALGLISLIGLSVAAAMQLSAGWLSDRDSRPGRRLPYILVGGIGLAMITVLFGFAVSFASLFVVILAMQLFGNFGQGAANALIIDHVPEKRRGEAAGVLNLWRLLGAGILTVIVLQFMANYDPVDARQWMWYSIILMVVVLIGSTIWTVMSLRPRRGLSIPNIRWAASPTRSPGHELARPKKATISRSYVAFLIALAFALAAMSSLQIYALFFLQDVVGLENPADGADLLVIIIVVAAGLAVVPAGWLADRLGRDKLFFFAGACGATGATLLLFVSSLGPVLFIGVIIGVTIGLFLTLTWTVANDLVSRTSAARELGYTSIATLSGAVVARFAGVGIDVVNERSENLGYKVMLVSVALAFALSAVLLAKVARDAVRVDGQPRKEAHEAAAAPD
ncbi:MAG: MFS transporter [Chloroflexi bacterium]|nr:MFS transporter [Chloroflexota bacterium]MCI0803694.1 MFS transporter [Chloroflexota bacterium]